MRFADIEGRGFSDSDAQYEYLRESAKDICGLLGRFPRLPDSFESKVVAEWDFGAFSLRKISYCTETDLPIHAYLLFPNVIANGPFPAVIALHQHNDEYRVGKSEPVGLIDSSEYLKPAPIYPDPSHRSPRPSYQYARELAERGFVVLAPDFIGFEEYREDDDSDWHPSFVREYEEILSAQFILNGSCLLAKHLHDVYVAATVIGATPGVDSERVGVFGHSLGGWVALVAAGFDRRIKAGVSSCGVVSYEGIAAGNVSSADNIIPRFRALGLDSDFFLSKIAPTPFLATCGNKEEEMNWVRKLAQGNIDLLEFDGGHELPSEVRRSCYRFLDLHLKGDGVGAKPSLGVEP